MTPETPFDFDTWFAETQAKNAARAEAAKTSPVAAHAAGTGYYGPAMPDKGKLNGSCNRSACQLPLAGQRQWFMIDCVTDEPLHYCHACAMLFNASDRQFGRPLRCTEIS